MSYSRNILALPEFTHAAIKHLPTTKHEKELLPRNSLQQLRNSLMLLVKGTDHSWLDKAHEIKILAVQGAKLQLHFQEFSSFPPDKILGSRQPDCHSWSCLPFQLYVLFVSLSSSHTQTDFVECCFNEQH